MKRPLDRSPARQVLNAALACVVLGACTLPGASPSSTPAPTATFAPTATPTPAPTPVWIDPTIPLEVRDSIQFPAGFVEAAQASTAALRIAPGEGQPIARWVYALVARFPTVTDEMSLADVRAAWSGQPPAPFVGQPLLLEQKTLDLFSALWHAPAAGATLVLPPGELLDYAWAHPGALALIPFEALEPRWKVLGVEGQSPLGILLTQRRMRSACRSRLRATRRARRCWPGAGRHVPQPRRDHVDHVGGPA
jgi:poly-gamma-glutamate synthesis protein (capsule biosynthesis protein)